MSDPAPATAPDAAGSTRRRSFARFALVSGLSFALNLGLTIVLHEVAGLSEEAAFAIALVVVLMMNFLALRYYIYPGGRSGRLATQLVLFLASSAAFRGVEYLAFLLGHTVIGLPYVPVIVAVQALAFVAKFLYYGAAIFRSK